MSAVHSSEISINIYPTIRCHVQKAVIFIVRAVLTSNPTYRLFYNIMAFICLRLQAFVALWSLFQFLNPIHSWYDSLDGGSARRKASAYTQGDTNKINTHTDIHASSEILTHDPSVRANKDSSCLRPNGPL
jgi:hypothetical protein